MKKLILFTILAFGLMISAYSQNNSLSDQDLKKAKTYNSLEEALKEPFKVYTLDLRYQELKTLPKEIGKLKNLKELNLWQNQLKALPKEIGYLKMLKRLNLRNNKLSEREKEKIKKLLPKCVIYF